MKYGYGREGEGIVKDGLYQLKKLEEYGADKILIDIDDTTLDMILDKAKEGDEIIVTQIYMLHDNIFEMLNYINIMQRMKIKLVILNQ